MLAQGGTAVWDLVVNYFLIALDISLVALLFYHAYLFLAKTGAVQIIIGIILLSAGAWAAQLANLQAASWLVQYLTPYVVFAILILMAPELRRIIAQVGQGRLFAVLVPRQGLRLDGIVEACRQMSADRIGALIVVARKSGLANYIEMGVRLESIISPELLRTIFNPEGPLHDGAVIIDQGRIEAAACYLPLSSSPALRKTIGARHRAGLGISEVSDAIAVICAEKTGRISLCVDGVMIAGIKSQHLKPLLTHLLTGVPNRAGLVRREGVPAEIVNKLGTEAIPSRSA